MRKSYFGTSSFAFCKSFNKIVHVYIMLICRFIVELYFHLGYPFFFLHLNRVMDLSLEVTKNTYKDGDYNFTSAGARQHAFNFLALKEIYLMLKVI